MIGTTLAVYGMDLAARIESYLAQQVVDYYPEWEWAETIVRIGQRIRTHFISNSGKDLFTCCRWSPFRKTRMIWAFCKHRIRKEILDCSVDNAKPYYRDCYFLDLKRAEDFFLATLYVRYLAYLLEYFLVCIGRHDKKKKVEVLSPVEIDYLMSEIDPLK